LRTELVTIKKGLVL